MSRGYGIDAPGVIARLGLGGIGLVGGGIALRHVASPLRPFAPMLWWWGSAWVATALLMLLYALRGKFIHRDRLLDLAALRDGETVLDVGTGRGLLAIGAARRVGGGRVIGVDIFQASDLSRNSLARTLDHLDAEGVRDRVEIRSDDARHLSLDDGSVDCVLSNLCLHNLKSKDDRAQALDEVARVLRPGGRALISDFRHVADYSKHLAARGLTVEQRGPYLLDTFPPLAVVIARKPS